MCIAVSGDYHDSIKFSQLKTSASRYLTSDFQRSNRIKTLSRLVFYTSKRDLIEKDFQSFLLRYRYLIKTP